ncbi:hypothetical protein NMS_2325 [Nonlabens marinus S1-08]|uniref:Ig-like domain-containing protein n=2 Tax=Nonlabens TaxID=363408 RepID=W8VRK9_9FLAO|nr:hypothetical protein NMS_2325 [Nonlabens marinus S1-08]
MISFAFAKAQLGFCTGASSEAIFTETFGQGTTSGPPLSAMQTTYRFVNSGVQDGEYTISSNLRQLGSFHNADDHTGNPNGKALIVNASFAPDQFYQTTINGLCENTNYEFSAWIINLYNPGSNACTGREVPVQVRFEIWDATDTNRLAQGVMNPRNGENQPVWIQYGLTFTTAAGQSGCILKMINEGSGGCGNDLAIDDIVFRTCGDVVQLEDDANALNRFRCSADPAESITLNVNTSEAVFTTPEYQWQSSTDAINFNDISGETASSYTTPLITSDTFYRVKIAEDAVNLAGSQCANFSEIFEYDIIEVPNASPVNDRVAVCDDALGVLEVNPATGFEVDWYDSATGGNMLLGGSSTFETSQAGFYYAELREPSTGCVSENRAEIEFVTSDIPIVTSANFSICPETSVTLDTEFENAASYEWSTGEVTPTIDVNAAGSYTCVVTNDQGCSATATFEVDVFTIPEITDLILVGDELQVITNDGNFLYSIDGVNYQQSNILDISDLLRVNVRVTDQNNCTIVTQTFDRIGIPDYFTPNADGFNDVWTIGNIEAFPGARAEIFDRYGKLLRVLTVVDSGWNGTFNNEPLPSSDYWYRIYYESQEVVGHFSLKR